MARVRQAVLLTALPLALASRSSVALMKVCGAFPICHFSQHQDECRIVLGMKIEKD